MYLDTLEKRNSGLIDCAFTLHQQGLLLPNTYIIDLDTLLDNGKKIMNESKKHGFETWFMTKQLGRNPLVCKELIKIGFDGAVVVDFQEAMVMMEHHIPIGHIGHLVQVPHHMLTKVMEYGVGIITVFSMEKAEEPYSKEVRDSAKYMCPLLSS